jgi:hypothetical protein
MSLNPKSFGTFDFGLEAIAGTAVSPGNLGMEFAASEITDEPITGRTQSIGGRKQTNSYLLGRDVGYSASGSVFASTVGYLMAHAVGGYAYTGGSTLHAWTGADFSDTADWGTMLQTWSMSENQNDMGEATAHSRRAAGCMCSSFEIKSEHRGERGVEWSISGVGMNAGEMATAVSSTVPSVNPLLHDDGTFKLGIGVAAASGTAINPQEWSIKVENSAQVIPGMNSNAQKYDGEAVHAGEFMATGMVKIPNDNTAIALWDHISAETANDATNYISFSASWTVASVVYTITVDKARITNDPHDPNEAASSDAYWWTIEFDCYGSTPITFSLVDAVAEDSYHYTAA